MDCTDENGKNGTAAIASLKEFVDMAWERKQSRCAMYQHYTTLPCLLNKILSRRWYLSRADSPTMNDTREMTRAFPVSEAVRRRTYLTCLSRCNGESVAMWLTYSAAEDPFAVRVSLPCECVDDWMGKVKEAGIFKDAKAKKRTAGEDPQPTEVEAVEFVKFRNVLYGALESRDETDTYDICRKNVVRWDDKVYGLKEGESFADIDVDGCEAWVKDYEWHHERETRLCVRLNEEIKSTSLFVNIPEAVVQKMHFTYSPWLDRRFEERVKGIIETALKSSLEGESGLKPLSQRFRRSVLQGALNFHR